MTARTFSLAFLIFWVVVAIGLWLRDSWMPAELREKLSDEKAQLGVLLAVVLVLWNLARFFRRSFDGPARPSPEVEEYRRRIRALSGRDPKVVNPEFNFDDPPADAPRRDEPPV